MNSTSDRNAVHIIVHGYVQGVGFRYYTRTHAGRLGIRGWVRNRPDGTVEIQAAAPHTTLEALVDAVRRGPSGSSVRDLVIDWQDSLALDAGFRITS